MALSALVDRCRSLLGGHSVRLVCLPDEADLINSQGFRVRIPARGRSEPIELGGTKGRRVLLTLACVDGKHFIGHLRLFEEKSNFGRGRRRVEVEVDHRWLLQPALFPMHGTSLRARRLTALQ